MKRVRIRLRGIVQGVGFRPFVHNLAGKWQLAGYVLNSSAGLIAEVEGDGAAVDGFVQAVRAEAPPLAWIQEMEVAELAPEGGTGFEIRHSAVETGEFALISPDVATCPDCLRDFSNLPFHNILEWRRGLDLARLALVPNTALDFTVPYWQNLVAAYIASQQWQFVTFAGIPAGRRGNTVELIVHPLRDTNPANWQLPAAARSGAQAAGAQIITCKSIFEVVRRPY